MGITEHVTGVTVVVVILSAPLPVNADLVNAASSVVGGLNFGKKTTTPMRG